MSLNVHLCPYRLKSVGGVRAMKKQRELSDEVARLLREAASKEEEDKLLEMGIKVKKPTRMTVIAAALYKKASGGELAAIKELLSVIGVGTAAGGVTLVDDIGKP